MYWLKCLQSILEQEVFQSASPQILSYGHDQGCFLLPKEHDVPHQQQQTLVQEQLLAQLERQLEVHALRLPHGHTTLLDCL
jgi:hypothetical protein